MLGGLQYTCAVLIDEINHALAIEPATNGKVEIGNVIVREVAPESPG